MRTPVLCGRLVRGVVLDLDGTLVNTAVDFALMKQRAVSALISRGVPPSSLNISLTTADNLGRAVDFLNASGRKAEIDVVHRVLGEAMSRTELERVTETTAVDGVMECISQLRDAGLRIGLLTRGSRPYALAALHHAGLEIRFDAMVCRDDFPEQEAKPNGKAMVRIAGMMGLRPDECVLVGDHGMDLSCARSVSAGFVGVLSGSFKGEDWSRTGCEVVIDSVEVLPRLLLDHNPYERTE